MSDNSQTIVDIDASPEDAERIGNEIRTWLVREGIVESESTPESVLGDGPGYRPGPKHRAALEPMDEDEDTLDFLELELNGLELVTGRTVFDSGGNGTELRCDACGNEFDPGTPWIEAVDAWFEGNDDVTFACPRCKATRRLTEWRGPWQWGFGNLGLQFWNWPPLSEEFVQSVSKKLGHRTVLVRSHL